MQRAQSLSGHKSLLELDCAELLAAYTQGRHCPSDVLQALRSAIEADKQDINAFCHLDWPGAFEAAQQSEQRYLSGVPLGPLDGVPVSIKDLSDVAGWPTRMGSCALEDAGPAKADAPAVARLRQGGALLFGKTTTTEFGWTIASANPLTGLTRNPLDPSRSAGGSSSGAAAQVAAGWGPLALGSDAGGSVRVPASYCGLVGFKPTFGAIPMIPSSAFTELAHLGVLSRSMSDCRTAMALLSHSNALDLASTFFRDLNAPSQPLRLGWALTLGSEQAPEPHVAEAFHATLERLRAAGYQLEEVDPEIRDCAQAMWMLWRSRMLESFCAWPATRREKLGPQLQQLYQEGQQLSMTDLAQARISLRHMAIELGRVFGGIDMLLTPTMPDAAPPAHEPGSAPESAQNWFRQCGYAYPFNVTGQPALSLPMGHCAQGLPLGVQVVGQKHHDAQVLQFGAELERLLAL